MKNQKKYAEIDVNLQLKTSAGKTNTINYFAVAK